MTDQSEPSSNENHLNRSRDRAKAFRDPNRPPVHVLVISLVSICTYIGYHIIDVFLLHFYYQRGDWTWFATTLMLMVIPGILVQLISCKWFHDDGDLKLWTIVMHVLFMGPIERYWNVFVYGLNTPRLPEQTSFKKKYLTNWRDVSKLRFLSSFMETGPQLTLQLYILLYLQVNGSYQQEYIIIIIKMIVTLASFAISMIAYNDDVSPNSYENQLSLLGYVFQILYRLSILVSRIITLSLFASKFGSLVFAVLLIHLILMVYWVKQDNPIFFPKQTGSFNGCFEVLFTIMVGFIYVFCYLATSEKCSVISNVIYCALLYLEDVSMVIAWVMLNGRIFDAFELSAIFIVFVAMALGAIFMFVYYKMYRRKCANGKDVGLT